MARQLRCSHSFGRKEIEGMGIITIVVVVVSTMFLGYGDDDGLGGLGFPPPTDGEAAPLQPFVGRRDEEDGIALWIYNYRKRRGDDGFPPDDGEAARLQPFVRSNEENGGSINHIVNDDDGSKSNLSPLDLIYELFHMAKVVVLVAEAISNGDF